MKIQHITGAVAAERYRIIGLALVRAEEAVASSRALGPTPGGYEAQGAAAALIAFAQSLEPTDPRAAGATRGDTTMRTTCPRCHGFATVIDKAPCGESGDVIRCDREETCVALHEAARDLEAAHSGVADAAQEFTRVVGLRRAKRAHADDSVYAPFPTTITIPGYVYGELFAAVEEWRKAGDALRDATVRHAAPVKRSA